MRGKLSPRGYDLRNQKLLILILCLFSQLAWSQVVRHDGTEETANDPKNANNMDMTDTERYETKTFIHQGLSDRTMREECAKLDDGNACQGNGKTKFLGMDSALVKMLSQAYATVMGMAGGGFDKAPVAAKPAAGSTTPTTPPAEGATPNAEASGKKETQDDYCKYVAMATEMGGQMMQQLQQSKISSTATPGENVQKTQLYKAAASHRAKAQTSTIAAVGWGATFSCYVYMGVAEGIVRGPSFYIKAAASGLMTSFYLSEIKKNNEYADEIKAIAEKLPGAGECNRITENDCYCAQPETMYDTQYCTQNLNNNKVGQESIRMTCVDNLLKADPQCRCIGSNTCFDKEFVSMVGGTNFGNAFLGSPDGDAFKSLTRGELKNGKTTLATAGQKAARQKARMQEAANQLGLVGPNVSSNQSGLVKGLEDLGLPSSLAKTLAAANLNNPAAGKYVARFQASGKASPYLASYSGGSGIKTMSFSGGSNFGRNKNSGNGFANPFDKLKKNRATSSIKSMNFAEKAAQEAQINKDKSRPIFEIISRRYQITGLRRLSIE